jgi:hypothetical protein
VTLEANKNKIINLGNNNKLSISKLISFSPEALSWKARIIANGGTISDAKLLIFDQNFFIPAKANGNILNQLDRLNIYCGLAGFEIAARTNMIKSEHFVSPVNSPIFDNNGYKSGGTGYLNLNYKLFSQGVLFSKNNNSFGVMVKNPAFLVNFIRMIGSRDASATSISALIRGSLNFLTANNTNTFQNTATTTQVGYTMLASKRSLSTEYKAIINTTETTILTPSSASNMNDLNVFELTINGGGTPDGQYDTMEHGASFHGSAVLNLVTLRTLLLNTFAALGL